MITGYAAVVDLSRKIALPVCESCKITTMLTWLMKGGPVMVPLAFCSIIYLALILYVLTGLYRLRQLRVDSSSLADEIAEDFEDFLERWIFPYRSAILWMNRLAGIATLLGLFGTVTGIQAAFADMELSQNISPETFARGINQALITTVAGLAMAIPGTALHFVFRDLLEKGERAVLRRLKAGVRP
jgi:biopolymer transport protein ExbB/TolQ